MSSVHLPRAAADRLRALNLFRVGYDTVEIASMMACSEAEAANLLGQARDMWAEPAE